MSRSKLRLWLGFLVCALIAGCAQPGTVTGAPAAAPTRAQAAAAEQALAQWQIRLSAYVAAAGQGDPAVLAALAGLRPAQIVFGVTDIDSTEPGRDGFDAVGLMVGRYDVAAGAVAYVFVVGIVERQASRPLALVDVRAVALTLSRGESAWLTGPADRQALALYEGHRDTDTVLRFPALLDRFALQPCASGPCVEERNSGARWPLY